MKPMLGRFLGFAGALGLLAVLSSPAYADHDDHEHGPKQRHSVPEIATVGAGAVGSLLVGGTLLLKSRRSSTPKQ